MKNDNIFAMRSSLTSCVAGFIIIGAIYVYGFGSERLEPDTIRDMILEWGYWGPALYIISNALRPFVLFPAMILGIAGGLAFGPLWGTIYLILGTVMGAALCFGAARVFGGDRLRHSLPQWVPLEELDNQAVNQGFRVVLLLRLAPLLPWDVVSFMAGLSKVRFWPYMTATIIGSVPGAIAFCFLGDSLTQSFTKAVMTAASLAVLAIGVYYLKDILTATSSNHNRSS